MQILKNKKYRGSLNWLQRLIFVNLLGFRRYRRPNGIDVGKQFDKLVKNCEKNKTIQEFDRKFTKKASQ